MGAKRSLVELALVVDDLAVVGKFARIADDHLAAQLGDVANRRDDRFDARCNAGRGLDMQRHLVVAVGIDDDQPRAAREMSRDAIGVDEPVG